MAQMNSTARAIAFWVIAILLAVYFAGTLHLAWPLVTGRASANGMPWWSVAGGFYLRFLVMVLLAYLLIRFKKPSTDK
ncbi:MAG: hypothetical protein ACRD4S_12975 [Candidatus Acidiferrales bacterium]